MKPTLHTAIPQRVWDNVVIDANSGCWVWTASLNASGYGQTMVDRKMARVHRLVYEDMAGPIPDGLVLDHLCRNRSCCNPHHLEPVTQRVNAVERGFGACGENSRKTHCVHGHEFTPENTRVSINRYGFEERQCRACARAKYHADSARQNARRAQKITCPDCGKLYSRSSLAPHRVRKH